jgi:TadE-like protein
MKLLTAFWRSRGASTAAEFGLITPLLIGFLIGTADVGRFLWTCNRAEKATQMGVRFAVATDIVPAGLVGYDFVTSGGLAQGDPIPVSSFGGAHCQSTGSSVTCTCNTGATCPPLGTANATAFTNIVNRMKLFYPAISANKVLVNYEYSGLGYAGDPNGTDVAPLVTVKLTGMSFTPLLFRFFGNSSVSLPGFSASLTLEDGSGTVSN